MSTGLTRALRISLPATSSSTDGCLKTCKCSASSFRRSSALIQQKNINDISGAASTLIEAKGERNKGKAPADELQQLERQRKILEEKKKIRELQNELNPADPLSEDQI